MMMTKMLSEAKKILSLFKQKLHGEAPMDEEAIKGFSAYVTYCYKGRKYLIKLTKDNMHIEAS